MDYFYHALRRAALEKSFGANNRMPFSSYLRAFKVAVASTVEKGGLLTPSVEMAIELVRMRTAQQHPMLMPTLVLGDLAMMGKSYDS